MMSAKDSILEMLMGNSSPEMQQAMEQDHQDNSNLSPTARRVLLGLPNLLALGSNVPGPFAMINGMIKGMAEMHIGKMPEDYLQGTLTYIIEEITTWRDGQVDTRGTTEHGEPQPPTDISAV